MTAFSLPSRTSPQAKQRPVYSASDRPVTVTVDDFRCQNVHSLPWLQSLRPRPGNLKEPYT